MYFIFLQTDRNEKERPGAGQGPRDSASRDPPDEARAHVRPAPRDAGRPGGPDGRARPDVRAVRPAHRAHEPRAPQERRRHPHEHQQQALLGLLMFMWLRSLSLEGNDIYCDKNYLKMVVSVFFYLSDNLRYRV